ncbi:MAG: hypothetical protein K1X88_03940 [Nannocystaceae bacterium]|nr:hypothetical protein [Nannocystaceae bacterium]
MTHRPERALVPLLLWLAACPADESHEVLPGGAFQHDPACMLDAPLAIEIGDGTLGFGALDPGEGPMVHFGSQGGQHMFVGVRIAGLALDRYDRVLVEAGWYEREQCPTLGVPCSGEVSSDEVWVLGDVAPLHPVGADTIEQDGMRLYLEYGGEIVLQVRAEDPCGQQGLAQIVFSY